MTQVSACRLCLATDVSMFPITDTPLQTVYENLTSLVLETKDERPVTACYICLHLLKKCHKLMQVSIKSDKLFTMIMNSGLKFNIKCVNMIDRRSHGLIWPLETRFVENSVVNVTVNEVLPLLEVKLEPIDSYTDEGNGNGPTEEVTAEGGGEREPRTETTTIQAQGSENSFLYGVQIHTEVDIPEDKPVMKIEPYLGNEVQWTEHTLKVEPLEMPTDYMCSSCAFRTADVHALEVHLKTHAPKKAYDCNVCGYKCTNIRQIKLHMKVHEDGILYKCGMCDYRSVEKRAMTMHYRAHNTQNRRHRRIYTRGTIYRCEKCDYMCKRPINLKKHLHNKHSVFECDHCGYTTTHKISLVNHIRIHKYNSNVKPVRKRHGCDKCSFGTDFKYRLKVHMQTHLDVKSFKCPECSFMTKTKKALYGHLKRHRGAPHHCQLCGWRTFTSSRLLRHMQVHTSEKQFKCEQCDYATNCGRSLKTHLIRHSDVKPWDCGRCEMKFESRMMLVEHQRRHDGSDPRRRPRLHFKCSHCEFTCSTQYDVVQHKNSCDKVIYKCHCGFTCKKAQDLKTHKAECTAPDVKYRCRSCDFTSNNLKVIRNHRRIHVQKQVKKCEHCGYESAHWVSFARHLRTHTGEKPFQCDACDYACKQKAHLVSHMRKHTGEKPFQCSHCDFRTGYEAALRKHSKMHLS